MRQDYAFVVRSLVESDTAAFARTCHIRRKVGEATIHGALSQAVTHHPFALSQDSQRCEFSQTRIALTLDVRILFSRLNVPWLDQPLCPP